MTQTSLSTITRINRDELVRLSEKGKANPGAVRTLKVKTVRAPSLFGAIAGLSLSVIDFSNNRSNHRLVIIPIPGICI
jgi:hypothetical protein